MSKTDSEHKPDGEDIVADSQGGSNRGSWALGTHEVTQNTVHLPEKVRALLRWFFHWGVATNLSLRDAAGKIGVDHSTVHKIYRRKYTNAAGEEIIPAKMLDGIAKLQKKVEKSQAAEQRDLVMTPTMRRIHGACDLAHRHGKIVTIWGTSQTGKTTALREYQRLHNHGQTKYILIEPSGGVHGMIRQFAMACSLSPKTQHDRMKTHVTNSLDASNLVIVDEVHLLCYTYRNQSKLSCLETLRWIQEKSGCGMVLCGTNVWRDELQLGKEKDKLDQLNRRAALQVQLPDRPTKGDLRAIFKSRGLGEPPTDAADVVEHLAATRGLTVIVETLRYGRLISDKDKSAFSWEYFLEAHAILQDLQKGKINDEEE